MKLTKCEQCGGPTAEGLPLCPDCMRATGAADANIREAIVGILNIAERLERGK